MTPDEAFLHLPSLRGKLTPAEKSALRATIDVVSAWDERARKLGIADGWRLSDEELESTRRALLGAHCAGQSDLWVYGYGSLMWDPGFHFTEVRLADLRGYQRRFSYKTHIARGTRERPALMLTLERGKAECCCRGLAFRIAAHAADVESGMLWRREMLRGGYRPALLPVTTPQGDLTALVMTVNPAHPDYAGELPFDDTAAMIAAAEGVTGTNRDYLEQLARQLDHLGIDDPYVMSLMQRVQSLALTQRDT
jgi:glutathione-specific gamma-glutamylcyclotransferase